MTRSELRQMIREVLKEELAVSANNRRKILEDVKTEIELYLVYSNIDTDEGDYQSRIDTLYSAVESSNTTEHIKHSNFARDDIRKYTDVRAQVFEVVLKCSVSEANIIKAGAGVSADKTKATEAKVMLKKILQDGTRIHDVLTYDGNWDVYDWGNWDDEY